MTRKTKNNAICVDLDRLDDTVYMEVITSSPAWERLEAYMRETFLVEFLNMLRYADLNDTTKERVINVFLRNLTEEERKRLMATIQVSDLLDTLIEMKK